MEKNSTYAPLSLLKITLSCLMLGVIWHIYRGSALHSFAFMHLHWDDRSARVVELSMMGIMAILTLVSLAINSKWTLGFLTLWLLIYAIIVQIVGGKHFAEYAVVANASRVIVPLVLLLFLAQKEKAGQIVIKIALSLTFAIHGIESLQEHPVFIDYLIGISQMRLEQQQAEVLLKIIGGLDILVSILIWTKFHKPALVWMIFWGFATAALRIADAGWMNSDEFLVRTPHFLLPWVLVRYNFSESLNLSKS